MQFDERLIAAKDGWDQKEISIRSVKGPLPTLMHCAPRTQIPRISCCTILPIVVKGLSKDLVSVPTTRTISSRKIVIPSNDSGYSLEKIVIRSKQSSAALLFQITSPEPFATNLSKDVSLNNSSKRCLLWSHEFSRYIFCWSLLCFHNISLIFIGPLVSWVPCLTLCDQSQFLFLTMILSNRTSSGVIIT